MNTHNEQKDMVNDTSINMGIPLTAKISESGVNEVHTVMLHFDALFDLRYAALKLISADYLEMIKIDSSYYRRQYDIFGDDELGYISKKNIDKLICQNVDGIIEFSEMTRIVELLLDYVSEYIDNAKMSPNPQDVKVLLNFGLYPFSDEKKLQVFDYINNLLEPMGVNTIACDYTLAQMNSQVLKNVQTLFIYDWLSWIEIHQASVEKGLFKLNLYCPKVVPMPDGKINMLSQAKQMLKDLRMTPYDFIKRGISKYIGMTFLDIQFFCVMDALNNPIVEDIHSKKK
jgi:hypothetical protein